MHGAKVGLWTLVRVIKLKTISFVDNSTEEDVVHLSISTR